MKLTRFAALSLAPFAAVPASAHPHVFIDIAYEIRIENGEIAGVMHQWTFSKEDSAFLILNLDTDGDGDYSDEELLPLAQENAAALVEFNYYSDLILDGSVVRPQPPREAGMHYDGERLTLKFYLPLETPAKPRESFVVDVYDPEIFIAFDTAGEKPIRLSQPLEGCSLQYEVKETPKMDSFSDTFLQNIEGDFATQFSKRSEVKCG